MDKKEIFSKIIRLLSHQNITDSKIRFNLWVIFIIFSIPETSSLTKHKQQNYWPGPARYAPELHTVSRHGLEFNSSFLRYIDMAFTDGSGVRKQDSTIVFGSVSRNEYGRDLAWNFLRDNWPKIVQ